MFAAVQRKKIPVRFSPPLPPPFSFSPLEPKLSAKQNVLPHSYIHQLSHNVKKNEVANKRLFNSNNNDNRDGVS